MTDLLNSIQNKVLQALSVAPSRQVVASIQQAAQSTGVDFSYLLQQAGAESSFDPQASAKTSSAKGLFQFIESTWMSMIERYGDKHGVDTSQPKENLLALRDDPEVASNMAAEFASENERILNRNWGGDVGATELYFAHFLGAGQASAFLNARDAGPNDPAAVLFPKAAEANKNVFFDKQTGRARSLDEVYAFFDKKFQNNLIDGVADNRPATMVAEAKTPAQAPASAELPANTQIINAFATMGNMDHFNAFNAKTEIPQSWHSLLYNQFDLMMLAQMDLPLDMNGSNNKAL